MMVLRPRSLSGVSRAWRRVATALPLAAASLLAQEPQFRERVEVQDVILEARVLGRHGEPLLGLGKDDFRVTVAGRPATLEAVSWEGAPDRETIAERLLAGEDVGVVAPPPSRLIVLFYQVGDDRSRLVGHVRMAREMGDFIDTLNLEDRVAVVAFGSQLRVLLDFTTDRDALAEATKATAINGDLPRPRRTGSPSLMRYLDWAAAAKATQPETALLLTAAALEPIPGPKTMLLLGWGLGHLGRGGVPVEDPDYEPARRALGRAHTTVFTLDVTDAASHSLEVGLQLLADDTGGAYMKTNEFPRLAMDLLERALVGHYELVFARPDLPDGIHSVKVELVGKRGTVLCQEKLELRH